MSDPLPLSAEERDGLGLQVDMLDVDRLRQWAVNVADYGPDLTHWPSPMFVAGWLVGVASRLEQTVRDVGTLRAERKALEAEREAALDVLNPSMRESGLVDAGKQVKQVAISEADNSEQYAKRVQQLEAEIAQLRASLAGARLWADEMKRRYGPAGTGFVCAPTEAGETKG